MVQVSGKGATRRILGSTAPTVQETVATWTDLVVGVVVVVLGAYVLVRALTG